ncbi:hypothetical protein H5410_005345 [Solanum commersonii]|uniref:Uncharacterized protein n=1 Tax=Solanum commersonii TaxID=4109 RepID=A0A9J6A7Z1_SOLCO|nr:hypothetical protein H5410_005345 [Solanum commersonii]
MLLKVKLTIPGFSSPRDPNLICKLKKATYVTASGNRDYLLHQLVSEQLILGFDHVVSNKNPDKSSEEVGSRFVVESYEGYGQLEMFRSIKK